MPEFITVCKVGDIPEGRGKTFTVADRRIAVFFVDGRYYALDDYCPHMGESLGLGEVHQGAVICDRHLWAFGLVDGVSPDVPSLKAETFEVRVQGDEIQVSVPAGE